MWVLVSLSFLNKLLWLSGPHLSEEEGVEGKDGVAWLSREMWGEVPQKCHQEPEIQHFHLCAWGELDFCGTCERLRYVLCKQLQFVAYEIHEVLEKKITFHWCNDHILKKKPHQYAKL